MRTGSSAHGRAWKAGIALISVAASTFGIAAQASIASAKAPSQTRYARVRSVCPRPKPGHATCFAFARIPVPASEAGLPGVKPFTVRPGSVTTGPAGGFTPADIAGAYGYNPNSSGTGQTVGVVDAYNDPSIESDLAKFDEHYGLEACTELNGCFAKVGQTGKKNVLPETDSTGWSVEMALDVEAVHATCPKCKIVLVESESTSMRSLGAAVNEAVALGATEVSNSYGGEEGSLGSAEEASFHHPGVVIAAATGDYGYDGWVFRKSGRVPPQRTNLPASLPSVVAVGGTTLELGEAGRREREYVWNGNGPLGESPYVEGATGGGCSAIFTAELWQRSAPGFAQTGCGTKRLDADVAAVADPITGFDIYDSFNCGADCEADRRGADWLTIGGTSLATPLVSAMYALAGGSNGISNPALTLYGHLGTSAVYDITEGGNGICDHDGLGCEANAFFGYTMDCEGTTACNAAPGFDGPSGVGAPTSLSLFKPLAPTAAFTLPASPVAGRSLSFSAAGSTDPYPSGLSSPSYQWSFGDDTTGSGATPTHTYASAGEYTVTLTVTDTYGVKSPVTSHNIVVGAGSTKEQEEAAKRKAEEEAAKKKAEEEAAKRKAGEEAAKKKAEEEAAKEKSDEQLALQEVEEAAVRLKSAEEAARKAAEVSATGQAGGVAGFKASAIPDATLASASLQASPTGAFGVKISCPAGETICEGSVVVQTAGAVAASAKASVLTLASGSFKVAGGKSISVVLHLSRKARRLLAREHTLRVRVKIVAHDPTGTSHTSQATASLRAPKKH